MIIYQIQNTKNGKVYIGMSTRGGNTRWNEHLRESTKANPIMVVDRAIRKHGKESFYFQILETFSNATAIHILEERERFLINKLKTFEPSKGYNRSLGSRSNAGYKRSRKARRLGQKRASVAVHQYSLDGTYLATYASGAEAERKTKVARASICSVLKGRLRHAGGFQWKHGANAASPSIAALPNRRVHNKSLVHCFAKNGRLVASYESFAAAEKATGIAWTNIQRAVQRSGRTSGGYFWARSARLTAQHKKSVAKSMGGRKEQRIVSIFDRSGRLLKTCKSVGEAARFAETCSSRVSECCRRKDSEIDIPKKGLCRFRYGKRKSIKAAKKKRKSGRSVSIAAYNAEGTLVAIFSSLTEAEKETRAKRSNITRVADSMSGTAGGYRWRYAGETPPKSKIVALPQSMVCQYDFHGSLVATFSTAVEAGKRIGITDTTISRAASGMAYSAHGFFWRLFPADDTPKRIKTPPPLLDAAS